MFSIMFRAIMPLLMVFYAATLKHSKASNIKKREVIATIHKSNIISGKKHSGWKIKYFYSVYVIVFRVYTFTFCICDSFLRMRWIGCPTSIGRWQRNQN